MCESGRTIPKTHDLAKLLEPLAGGFPALELARPILESLSGYAVVFRYPGASATKSHALQARHECRLVRQAVRGLLGLTDEPALRSSRGRLRSGKLKAARRAKGRKA